MKRELHEARERGPAEFEVVKNKIHSVALSAPRGVKTETPVGLVLNEGLQSESCITNEFVAIVAQVLAGNYDESQVAYDLGNFNHHRTGTGTTAESATNTYSTFTFPATSPWATGTPSAGANYYSSAATVVYTGTLTISEHGLFNRNNDALPPKLMDRTLLDVSDYKSVISDDAVTWTYTVSLTAGT
jgi:hypothetical protein